MTLNRAVVQGGLLLEVVSSRAATAEECTNGGTVYTYNHSYQDVVDAISQGILPLTSMPNGDSNNLYIATTFGVGSWGYGIVCYNVYVNRSLTLIANSTSDPLITAVCDGEEPK